MSRRYPAAPTACTAACTAFQSCCSSIAAARGASSRPKNERTSCWNERSAAASSGLLITGSFSVFCRQIRSGGRSEQCARVLLRDADDPVKHLADRDIAPQLGQDQQPDFTNDQRPCAAHALQVRARISFDTGQQSGAVATRDEF